MRGAAFDPLITDALAHRSLAAEGAVLAERIRDWDGLHDKPGIALNDEEARAWPGRLAIPQPLAACAMSRTWTSICG